MAALEFENWRDESACEPTDAICWSRAAAITIKETL
jgi:hypothetical protein